MDKNKKQSYIIHSAIIIVGIALMILAGFKDLEISQALGNKESFLGLLFVTLGEWPAYTIVPLAGTIFFFNRNSMKTANASKGFGAFSILVCFVGWAVWMFMGSRTEGLHFMDHDSYTTLASIGIILVYSTIFTIISFSVGRLVKPETMNKLFKWAVFALVVLLVTLIVSRIMKSFWGRMRFRDMIAAGDYSGFTPWWEVLNGQGSSFPSGHSTSAANIFIFVVLCDIFPNVRKYKTSIYIGCALFTLGCMFSRILNNAHFLSDVVIGGGLAYFEFVILRKLFFKNDNFTFNKLKQAEDIELATE